MNNQESEDFRKYFYGEFSIQPAMPWACRNCGRGYIGNTQDGRCPVCDGRLKKIPWAEERKPE